MALGRLHSLGSWEGKWLGSVLGLLPREPSLGLGFSPSRVRALPKSWHPPPGNPSPLPRPPWPSLPYLPPAALTMSQTKGLQDPQGCCPTPQDLSGLALPLLELGPLPSLPLGCHSCPVPG